MGEMTCQRLSLYNETWEEKPSIQNVFVENKAK